MRGAYPGAWYSESFKCLDRSAKGKLGTRAVNDGYCDCADGSDEPGTPACPMGRFFCKNADHRGSFISSSLVDDGICDCCDGSDEEGTSVSCQDTCAAEAAKEKELALVTQKHEEIGERARAQMAAAAQEVHISYPIVFHNICGFELIRSKLSFPHSPTSIFYSHIVRTDKEAARVPSRGESGQA